MELLAKTNPTATRGSIIRHAIVWGSISVVACLTCFVWSQPHFSGWPFFLPLAGLLGAAIGALMEWQLDDGVEIYYVVQEVEDEFEVKIPQWETIDTVDDLYCATLVSLREKNAIDVNDEDIWRRLKGLLVKQLALEPEKVVPSARFYVDLPI